MRRVSKNLIRQQVVAQLQTTNLANRFFTHRGENWKCRHEACTDFPTLSTLWSVLPCSHNRRIMTLKTAEERGACLLFFHRHLQCLVAFELKNRKFKPADLGQLEFYLEALDRDVKLAHENPSIGVLLCREKDDEVVQYALNRSLSPTVIADYETKLISKELLRKKLNEFYAFLETDA